MPPRPLYLLTWEKRWSRRLPPLLRKAVVEEAAKADKRSNDIHRILLSWS